jgi:hypothetical protein
MTISNYKGNGSRLWCGNASTDTGFNDNCRYFASQAGISIDSVSVTGSPANAMTLTLSEGDVGFAIDATKTEASFRGVKPDSFDANALIFGNGVPVSITEDGAKPVLVFKGEYEDGTSAEFYADYAEGLVVSGLLLDLGE